MSDRHDAWTAGESYERYMGRWSRLIADLFLDWLAPAPGRDWLEIGCGSGALTAAILARAAPKTLLATDRSADFLHHTAAALADARLSFMRADATALPVGDDSRDVVTSGLVLNFVPDRAAALREARRVLRPGGRLAFYVWDYPNGGMGFIDAFWRAAAACDPAAAALDEGARFPFCTAAGLTALCEAAGVATRRVAPIETETRFADFDAFWEPFTLGAGPAPGYAASLDPEARARLRAALARELDTGGPVVLPARVWAVDATMPLGGGRARVPDMTKGGAGAALRPGTGFGDQLLAMIASIRPFFSGLASLPSTTALIAAIWPSVRSSSVSVGMPSCWKSAISAVCSMLKPSFIMPAWASAMAAVPPRVSVAAVARAVRMRVMSVSVDPGHVPDRPGHVPRGTVAPGDRSPSPDEAVRCRRLDPL
ncbi:class I SAM-dependent methyltransferase [Jannaschia ovalis]|uniref:Class I SAM-dependent methyltransferase n=1 Tax=Jannaschia ovalis TaxID=3038773 RepID=A0ABY8LCW6_9RHOB|nr:class I SAM-dependent methyltransferase [Jannaschia sp. GRR-S6-38]WGH79164.1 class I SAM-dependent methyltransferase [Jannaschia sp. GRR-S6-38]